jgi:hypothetical protein
VFSVPPQRHDTPSTSKVDHSLLQRIERLESFILPQDGRSGVVALQQVIDGEFGTSSSPEYHEAENDVRLLDNLGTRDNSLVPLSPYGH